MNDPICVLIGITRSKKVDIDDAIDAVRGYKIATMGALQDAVSVVAEVEKAELVEEPIEEKPVEKLLPSKADAESVRLEKETALQAEIAELKNFEFNKVSRKEAEVFAKTVGFGQHYATPTVKGTQYVTEQLYVETVDEIAEIEKSGSLILAARHWDGAEVEGYPVHADIGKFMPKRSVTVGEGDEAVTTMVDDPTPRLAIRYVGQAEWAA